MGKLKNAMRCAKFNNTITLDHKLDLKTKFYDTKLLLLLENFAFHSMLKLWQSFLSFCHFRPMSHQVLLVDEWYLACNSAQTKAMITLWVWGQGWAGGHPSADMYFPPWSVWRGNHSLPRTFKLQVVAALDTEGPVYTLGRHCWLHDS